MEKEKTPEQKRSEGRFAEGQGGMAQPLCLVLIREET